MDQSGKGLVIKTRAARRARRLAAVALRARDSLRPDPTDRWAVVLGRIALYSFGVAVVTGILLLPYFRPSMAPVTYRGSYRRLDGLSVSQAYQSVLAISFDIRGGLLVRQVHHWSAEVFVAALCLRLLHAFFRGRFSGQARLGWLIWVTLLPLGMLASYTGTILPDDMLSGGSLSVITGTLLSIPWIGTQLVGLIFGGEPPGHQIIGSAYWVHIIVLPVVVAAVILPAFRPSYIVSFRPWLGRARRLWLDPLLPFTCAAVVLLGAFAQINPVWLIGPHQASTISVGSAPDWYMAFLDGALRIMPAWEVSIAGHPLSLGVLIAGLLVAGAFFTFLALYPTVDHRITGRRPPSGWLPAESPDVSNRIAVGVAGITFYGLLWAASSNDELAYHLHVALFTVTWIFRVAVLAGPVLAFFITRGVYRALVGHRRDEELHGRETGRILMTPQGGYLEIREPARRALAPTAIEPGPETGRRAAAASPDRS